MNNKNYTKTTILTSQTHNESVVFHIFVHSFKSSQICPHLQILYILWSMSQIHIVTQAKRWWSSVTSYEIVYLSLKSFGSV